ncbi:IS200/IS605 family transposase [Nocardia sp. NPDC056611]|uniref:IS200/IS605 family transposase n=1 Tax=Nocardia sp. NPDC056611 TaxID=3345877 RepID=UPI003670D727
MDGDDRFRPGRQVVSRLYTHLVFITKYQRPLFTDAHLRWMETVMRHVCEDFECELVEFDGGTNHAHLLVRFPPKVQVSRLVNSLKGVSSRLLRKEFEGLRFAYWNETRLWSGSYFAESVSGAPRSEVQQFITQQTHPSGEDIRATTGEASTPHDEQRKLREQPQ